MERRDGVLLASLLIVSSIAVCGGAVWAVMRTLAALDGGGDGITAVEDPRPARVTIHVTDDAGRPMSGAHVDAFHWPPWWGDFESKFGFDPASEPTPALAETASADGVATLTGLGSGDWTLAVRSMGRATEFVHIKGGHAARHVVRLQLGEARSLRGQVAERDGTPVADATVLACETSSRQFREEHWLGAVRAHCGAEGEFVLHGLPSGVLALWVVMPGDVPVEAGRALVPHSSSIDITLPAVRKKATVRVQPVSVPLSAEAGSGAGDRTRVRGYVASADGTLIDGAYVGALHHGEYGEDEVFAWTHTGEDGAFSLEGIPLDASIALRVSADDHVGTTTPWDNVADFRDDATYRLEPAVRIVGIVRTPDGSQPQDLRVWIYRLGEDEEMAFHGLSVLWAGCPMWFSRAPQTPVSDASHFEMPWRYDPARLVVYVAAEGFAPTVSAPFDVASGGGIAQVDVELDPGVELRGRLVGPDGEPLAHCPVRIRPPAFVKVWGAVAAETDENGRFAIAYLPRRPIVITAGGSQGRDLREETITPTSGEIEIRLRRRREEDDEDGVR